MVCFKILLATCILGQQNKKTKQELDIHFPWENNTELQARRPSSVTRGGGGRKNIWGGTDKFYLSEDQKQNKKKGFQPCRWPSFGAQVSLGGALRNLMMRISLLAHKFSGEDQQNKNVFGTKS